MTWRRTIVVTAALVCLAVAPARALAQPLGGRGQSEVIFSGAGGPVVQTSIPVRMTGQLTVQYHGSAVVGCARWGLCDYGGIATWRPPAHGAIVVSRVLGRHPATSVDLLPAGLSPLSGGVTTTAVTLGASAQAPSMHCVDAAATGAVPGFSLRHGSVRISLTGTFPSVLSSRCAGPRDPDVLPALPSPSLSLRALRRGHRTISLAASRPLDAHGFTGSITSTLLLRLGAPGRSTRAGASLPAPGRGGTRVREIHVGYRATISGSIVEEVRGAADPLLCAPLGSCGTTGAITFSPRARTEAALTARQLITRSRRRLLAAVGLAAGPAGTVTGFGSGSFRGGGTMAADLTQEGRRCDDAAPVGPGFVVLDSARGRLHVSYVPAGFVAGGGSMTRCPSPLPTTDVAARGSIPLSLLRRRTVRIALATGSRATDPGYTVRFVPRLTLTLTRVRVRTTVVTLPAGVSPALRRGLSGAR